MTGEEAAELDFLVMIYEQSSIDFYNDPDYRKRFIELHNILLPNKALKRDKPDCINRGYYNILNDKNG